MRSLFISPGHKLPSHCHSPLFLCPGSQVVATYHGDHAYSFDSTGAAAPAAAPAGTTAAAQQRAGGGAPLPVNLFEHPTAMAALVARNRGGAGGSGGGSGTSSGFTSSGSGGMGDLPGMLPAAAERAKADGNLHLFSKKVRLASRSALPVAHWSSSFSNRMLLPACATLMPSTSGPVCWPRAAFPFASPCLACHHVLPRSRPAVLRGRAAVQRGDTAGALGARAVHQQVWQGRDGCAWEGSEASGCATLSSAPCSAPCCFPRRPRAHRCFALPCRALALLQRGWEGDALCALRDAETGKAGSPVCPAPFAGRLRSSGPAPAMTSCTSSHLPAFPPGSVRPLPPCATWRIRAESSMRKRARSAVRQTSGLHTAPAAVCLEPGGMKAHYRRAQALRAAGMLQVRAGCVHVHARMLGAGQPAQACWCAGLLLGSPGPSLQLRPALCGSPQSAAAAVRLFKQQFPDKAGDVEALEEQVGCFILGEHLDGVTLWDQVDGTVTGPTCVRGPSPFAFGPPVVVRMFKAAFWVGRPVVCMSGWCGKRVGMLSEHSTSAPRLSTRPTQPPACRSRQTRLGRRSRRS